MCCHPRARARARARMDHRRRKFVCTREALDPFAPVSREHSGRSLFADSPVHASRTRDASIYRPTFRFAAFARACPWGSRFIYLAEKFRAVARPRGGRFVIPVRPAPRPALAVYTRRPVKIAFDPSHSSPNLKSKTTSAALILSLSLSLSLSL